ncbi:protein MANNAN SYNTHESIS-RELATED 2-like [Mercurialis annua]|uniref:protein MANNAN SYNTHESIS-RELATED 2-like n=1 Tax=Mercurialis annua TaxID=3986 RepID=UPI00215E60A9|nr:protein MANNAN SYNTHESIS-RELATED 2-like [Mercurialis annua]
MGVDLRQVVAGILTLTMFVMLGNMIKRDHFDSVEEKFPGDADFDSDEHGLVTFAKSSKGAWREDSPELKPCWSKSSFDTLQHSKGYLTFSLTNGPEYHISQIADAVVVAKYLGATIVLPDIRGNKPGDERKFGEIYDVEKFVQSLDGVVKVVNDLPDNISLRDFAVVKVPNRVTEDYITESIEPVFRTKGNIRLATYFPSVNMRKTAQKSDSDYVACLAMFGTLELQAEVREVVNSMVERLRTLSRKSEGQFIAVDLRVEMLEKKSCQGSGSGGAKTCYNAQEIALFLRKMGFDTDTNIYLTQSRWDDSLDILKDIFPKTYTKESIMPEDKKTKFLESEDSEFEKVIDFYICSRSDVFVPAISGLFYANVAGKRIASGKTQILVPAEIPGSTASVTNHFSPYISKKNHLAYSCFC